MLSGPCAGVTTDPYSLTLLMVHYMHFQAMCSSLLQQMLQRGSGLIRRCIIDHNDFQAVGGIIQRKKRAEAALKFFCAIVAGNDDRDRGPYRRWRRWACL